MSTITGPCQFCMELAHSGRIRAGVFPACTDGLACEAREDGRPCPCQSDRSK